MINFKTDIREDKLLTEKEKNFVTFLVNYDQRLIDTRLIDPLYRLLSRMTQIRGLRKVEALKRLKAGRGNVLDEMRGFTKENYPYLEGVKIETAK